jgi:outer membrane protein
MSQTIIVSHRACLTLTFAVLGIVSAARAEPLTRASAVQRAVAQNPEVAASRMRVARARSKLGQADAARWPVVSVDLGLGPSLKADLVPGTAVESTRNRYSEVGWRDLSVFVGGSVSVLQPLYTFGKIGWRRAAADQDIQARRAQVRMTQADIALEVARLYEGQLYARDAIRFFDDALHWMRRTIETVRDNLSKGVANASEQDLLRLQTAVALGELGMHRAVAARDQTAAGLAAYLGLSSALPLEMRERELRPIAAQTLDVDRLILTAREQRPELEALQHGVDAYRKLARAERAGYLPDVFLLAFVSAAYTPGRDWVQTRYVVDPLNHFDPGVLVGLSWRFQGDGATQRAREAQSQADELQELRRWANDGVPAEVRRAYADAQRARDDLADADDGAARAKAWMVRASADYSIGMADVQDLSDSVQAYVELRTSYLDAEYRYNVAMAELSRATGSLGRDPALYPGKEGGK